MARLRCDRKLKDHVVSRVGQVGSPEEEDLLPVSRGAQEAEDLVESLDADRARPKSRVLVLEGQGYRQRDVESARPNESQ